MLQSKSYPRAADYDQQCARRRLYGFDAELSADAERICWADRNLCQWEYPPARGLQQDGLGVVDIQSRGEEEQARNRISAGMRKGI